MIMTVLLLMMMVMSVSMKMVMVMMMLVFMVMMMVMHPIVRRASRAQRGSPAELERFAIELSLSVNCRPSTVKYQKATVNYQVKCSIGQQLPQLNSVWLSCRA